MSLGKKIVPAETQCCRVSGPRSYLYHFLLCGLGKMPHISESLKNGDNNLRQEIEVRKEWGDIKCTLAFNKHLVEVSSDYYQFMLPEQWLQTQSCLFLTHQAPDRMISRAIWVQTNLPSCLEKQTVPFRKFQTFPGPAAFLSKKPSSDGQWHPQTQDQASLTASSDPLCADSVETGVRQAQGPEVEKKPSSEGTV